VLSTYGSELEHCPRMLRSMIPAIVPKAYEEELLTKPECTRNDLDIIAWCRQKTQILRTRELSDFTRRLSGSSSRVTALAATAKDHSTDAQGDSLPPLKPLPMESAPSWGRSYLQQSGSQATNLQRSPLASDRRDQQAQTPESQLDSSLWAAGIARTPITPAVEVGMAKARSAHSSQSY
jgi:hypothetical protein